MDATGIFLFGSTACAALALLAVVLGPLLGWRPAARYEEFHAFGSTTVPRKKIRDAIARLGWTLLRDQPGDIVARTRVSWRSWSELVSLEFRDHGAVIRSECTSRSQLADFGKNRLNVRHMINTLRELDA